MIKSELKINTKEFFKEVEELARELAIQTAYDIRDKVRESMKRTKINIEITYNRPGGRKHHPSKKGYPPAVDFGRLHDSISVNWFRSGMSNGKVLSRAKKIDGVKQPKTLGIVNIGTQVPYSYWLEIGYLKRPFLRPQMVKGKVAFEKAKSKLFKEFKGKFITKK